MFKKLTAHAEFFNTICNFCINFATFLLPFSVTKYEKEKVFGINDLFSGLKLGDN